MLKDPTAKVLVMVPTRELALQIDEEFMGFARTLQIYSVLLVGGASIGMQIERLRRKVRMVIGTRRTYQGLDRTPRARPFRFQKFGT